MEWMERTATIPSGEYSTTQVRELVTQDGAFSIVRTGSMQYRRVGGPAGSYTNAWRWMGYTLTDHRPGRPAWVTASTRLRTLAAAKREAERRALRALEG